MVANTAALSSLRRSFIVLYLYSLLRTLASSLFREAQLLLPLLLLAPSRLPDCACCACPGLALPSLLFSFSSHPSHLPYMYDVRPLIPTQLVDQPIAPSIPYGPVAVRLVSPVSNLICLFSDPLFVVRLLSSTCYQLSRTWVDKTRPALSTPRQYASRLSQGKRTHNQLSLIVNFSIPPTPRFLDSSIPRFLDFSTPRFLDLLSHLSSARPRLTLSNLDT